MTDTDVIAALIGRLGNLQAVADRLGESSQVLVHWRDRGIAWPKRKKVADLAREERVRLPADFLTVQRPGREARAA